MAVSSETGRDEVEGLLIILDEQNAHRLGLTFGGIGLDGSLLHSL
jgi:hypothetical protein